MDEVNEFTDLFHSINGANIKEKYRNFNKFSDLLKLNFVEADKLKHFVKSLDPKTTLEDNFRIGIIIQSKNKELIINELKTNNAVLVKKLLRDWQLFEKLFLDITARDLVNNILPHLSYSLKLKILNGIRKNVKNEQLLDEYFDALEARYGLKIATSILTGCSINLIRSQVEKFHLKLLQPHLKEIFKKDKQFVDFYFDTLKKKYENLDLTYSYLRTLKYIAKVDPQTFWKLHDKYELKVKFGKYMTPTMVKTHENVSKEGPAALDLFHYLKLFETTKKEGTFDSFLLSLFPEHHDLFKDKFLTYDILKFISKGSAAERYRLVSLYFSKKYKRDLLDYPDYFTEDLLKMTPIKERQTILDIKVHNNEDLFYLYGSSTSIPRLKKQLQHSSDSNTRGQIGALLCKTCLANKDDVALLDLLRYVTTRHKNDKTLLSMFVTELTNWPDLVNLSEEHWQYITKINANLENMLSHFWTSITFTESYISHLIKNKKPIQNIVKKNIEDIVKGYKHHYIHPSLQNDQKEYYDELASCLDSYKEHPEYKRLCKDFLYHLGCRRNRKKVEIYDYARFFDQLDDHDWICFDASSKSELIHEDRIHETFWKLNSVNDDRLILWYAEHRPDLLRKNARKLFSFMNMRKIDTFLLKLKKLCDPDILQELKEQALHFVQDEKFSEATFSVHAISIFASDYFTELITALLPPMDGKIILEESVAEKVNLQKEIAKGLYNVEGDPSKLFPFILKFCIGDYLKFGLQPLYKSAYNMPELEIKNYLEKLSDTAMSVKKHLLFLSKDVFTKDDFYELLRDWSQKETNLSMRNILLKKSIQHFIESPSARIWLLVKSNLNSMDVNDREMYEFLLKFDKIPLNYQSKYIELIYKTLSSNSDPKINERKFSLINTIPTRIIREFDVEFLKQIIRETTFGESSTDFNWKSIFYAHQDIQLTLFDENLAKLKQFVETNSSNLNGDGQSRKDISSFIYSFINLTVQLKQGLHFIQKFISIWDSVFHLEMFCKDCMMMRFAELYFKSKFNAYQIGLKVNDLLYEYLNKYNNSIIDLFCNELCSFLTMISITRNEEDKYKFVEGFLHDKKDENVYITIMYFLPKTLPAINNMYAKYIPIISAIEGCVSPIIQYHFDEYLTND